MTILFDGMVEEHNGKINEFLEKEKIKSSKNIELSERKNETDKSYIYFLKAEDNVYQLTINKESGNLMPRKGNYKLENYKWTKGKVKRKSLIDAFKNFLRKK